jgi:hypothetical protein
MRIIREVQKDTMVYWAYTGADEYGQPIYANPVQLTCRWDDCQKQVFTEDGSPVFSKVELIVPQALKLKSLVKKGPLTGTIVHHPPRANDGVHEILMVEETPMLKTRSVTLFEAYA